MSDRITIVQKCPQCRYFEDEGKGYCWKLERHMDDEAATTCPIPDDCPLPSNNIAADRLYLLWIIEEQVLSALDGHISQEHALKNILSYIGEHSAEMTATESDQEYLFFDRQERFENLGVLIDRSWRMREELDETTD